MFSIEMFPAAYGDALWIEYGDPPRRILIDGGKAPTADAIAERIREVASQHERNICRFELVVLSHIDGDHIEGLIKLLQNLNTGAVPAEIGEVWFNGAPQLPAADQGEEPAAPGDLMMLDFGGVQGEMLGAVLLDKHLPWNQWSSFGPIFVPSEGRLPSFELDGGMVLTLLGPSFDRLKRLRRKWDREIAAWMEELDVDELTPDVVLDALADRREGRLLSFAAPGDDGVDVEALIAGDADEDASAANGSSISLLAEYGGKRALLTGDAFASDTAAAIRRLLAERAGDDEPAETLAIDAFKVPHHASRNNVSDDLLSVIDCDAFLISTNGAVFDHPDDEAIARIVAGGGRRDPDVRARREIFLQFNYRTPRTLAWSGDDAYGDSLPAKWNFRAAYPDSGERGLKVILD